MVEKIVIKNYQRFGKIESYYLGLFEIKHSLVILQLCIENLEKQGYDKKDKKMMKDLRRNENRLLNLLKE